jgi:hypothetical protein
MGDLQTFADASFAPEGKSSVSGWVVIMNGGAISWDSRKQDPLAQSSCEAECIALSEIAREALQLRKLRPLIGLPNCPVNVWCANTGTLALADHDTSHRRSKHIALRFHSVRERVAREDVTLHYVPSEENTADLFTKSLGKSGLDYLREKMGMKSSLHT